MYVSGTILQATVTATGAGVNTLVGIITGAGLTVSGTSQTSIYTNNGRVYCLLFLPTTHETRMTRIVGLQLHMVSKVARSRNSIRHRRDLMQCFVFTASAIYYGQATGLATVFFNEGNCLVVVSDARHACFWTSCLVLLAPLKAPVSAHFTWSPGAMCKD